MSVILVLLFMSTVASGAVADAVRYRPFAGIEREVRGVEENILNFTIC